MWLLVTYMLFRLSMNMYMSRCGSFLCEGNKETALDVILVFCPYYGSMYCDAT